MLAENAARKARTLPEALDTARSKHSSLKDDDSFSMISGSSLRVPTNHNTTGTVAGGIRKIKQNAELARIEKINMNLQKVISSKKPMESILGSLLSIKSALGKSCQKLCVFVVSILL